ncbi:NitT/TauT family transport system substrate-binding protein [Kribbella voronezhensis]|uniref:NitT/TauT family transport system substrate-binding protein n=1 Tax=Kribbella voronezhensis TaxID=2512212 RepID=A0A4V3FKT9_9ACTN|nr:ABC transporter substrate-binding protein [Kribbella voronezhensis]TDU91503.1 NitT/TauT family transport system substrate-binding protein [Kribbella voronezhensis]
MTIRPAAIGVPVLAAALVLTGCQTQNKSGTSSGSSSSDKVTIMVGGAAKVIYMPAKLTEQLGYFKDQGLNVELVDTPAGVTAETALLANQAQGVVGFYDHTIDMQAKGKCLQSVVQFANVPGEVEMVSKAQAGTIKSPADFKGRKLGVTSAGSSTDFLTQYLAGNAGVGTADYTTVKAGADSTFIAAMNSGGIDAGMTTDPTVARLTKTGDGKILLDLRTEEGTKKALGGLYPASSLYMACDYVAAHKDVVQKLANAFVKTLGFITSNDAATIAAKMPADYAGTDKQLYIKSITDSKGMFNATGVMDPDGAKNALAVLGKFSPAVKPKKDTIDIAKTYTTEFAKAAKS